MTGGVWRGAAEGRARARARASTRNPQAINLLESGDRRYARAAGGATAAEALRPGAAGDGARQQLDDLARVHALGVAAGIELGHVEADHARRGHERGHEVRHLGHAEAAVAGVLHRHLGVVDGVHVEVDEHRAVLVGDRVEGERGRRAHAELAGGRGREGEAEVAERRALAGIEVAEAEQRDVVGDRTASPCGDVSPAGPRPSASASAIPLRKPDGVVSGVFRSAWASR